MPVRSLLAAVFALAATAASAHDSPLTDAQIAHIAYTAGQIDVAAAELALSRTQDAKVRDFAELMKRDHGAVNDQALALVTRLGVTPEDNATSQALAGQAADTAARLGALSGAAFDRAYVMNEVAYHRTVNEALRGTLIPAAHDPEFKAFLETGLALFESHQAHSEMLEAEIK